MTRFLVGHEEFLRLFEEASLAENWRRVWRGLRQPCDTGEYKFARLQLLRLSAPAAAVVLPAIAILLIAWLSLTPRSPWTDLRPTRLMDPTPPIQDEPLLPTPDWRREEPSLPPDPLLAAGADLPSPQPGTAEAGPSPVVNEPMVRLNTALHAPSPVVMPGLYRNRMHGPGGGPPGARSNAAAEGAVLRALRWLKKNQEPDGSWPKHKVAMTGFALLAFLGHGETTASDEFGPTVEKALRFLLANRMADGGFPRRYEHPIATYALCEAYGMTRMPTLKPVAEACVRILIVGQNPLGGWRYTVSPSDPNDTTVMSWCVQALKAAKVARLEVDGLDAALARAAAGLRANFQDAGESGGGFGYTGPGVTGLTGAGVLCLQLLGQSNAREVVRGLKTLERSTFNWEGQGAFEKNYYWYYITQAKFHAGGENWDRWNALFSSTLVRKQTVVPQAVQDPTGRWVDAGFWEMPETVSGLTDGVVMNTCLCALQLEVYYRILPLYQAAAIEESDPRAFETAGSGADVAVTVGNL
jgi:hypothetical protein